MAWTTSAGYWRRSPECSAASASIWRQDIRVIEDCPRVTNPAIYRILDFAAEVGMPRADSHRCRRTLCKGARVPSQDQNHWGTSGWHASSVRWRDRQKSSRPCSRTAPSATSTSPSRGTKAVKYATASDENASRVARLFNSHPAKQGTRAWENVHLAVRVVGGRGGCGVGHIRCSRRPPNQDGKTRVTTEHDGNACLANKRRVSPRRPR